MTSVVDIDAANQMRREGQTLKDIGDHFGVTRERIRQLVDPLGDRPCARPECDVVIPASRPKARYCSHRCANRTSAEKRFPKHPCVDCGGPAQGERCVDCKRAQWERERTAHFDRLKELWDAGASMRDIADELGTTTNALGVKLHRARAAGWDLPLRRVGPKTEDLTRRQARDQFAQALRAGTIRRPKRCEGCGKEGRVDGHHHDYNRPLFVEWLCPACHREAHREMAA